jgi:hypothetical protein
MNDRNPKRDLKKPQAKGILNKTASRSVLAHKFL